MWFSHLETQTVAFILIFLTLRKVQGRQVVPSALLEALEELDITKSKQKSKPGSLSIHGVGNRHFPRRYPSGFSYSPNCPLKQELLFLGGPCGPMRAIGCGGFGCGSGIGFPISTVCCCSERNNPSQENNSAKRFDITSFPAAHPSKVIMKKRPKPSKDSQRHPKLEKNKNDEEPVNEGPKIDLELKLNDEPKAAEDEEVVVGRPLHNRPWFPYMHRPLYPFHRRPHYFPRYMPHTIRFQRPTYWHFQGYFPQFMRRKRPWAMNPYDVRNVHFYPEYQFGDVQFSQSHHPFRSRPPFRDYNDLTSRVELLDQQEKLHEDLTHIKNKINSHKDYNGLHQEDRKMVDDSEDSRGSFKLEKLKQKGAVESERETNIGTATNQGALKFNPTLKEDEATNYPEYTSEFNTDHFWSSAEKRRGKLDNPVGQVVSRGENAIFKDLSKGYHGFDLDDIANSHSKRKDRSKKTKKVYKEHKIVSRLGDVKLKYDRFFSTTGIMARGF